MKIETTEFTQEIIAINEVAPGATLKMYRALGADAANDAQERLALSGDDFKKMMRRHGWTIKRLADKSGFYQYEIRERRENGVKAHNVTAWFWHMTGVWLA